MLPLGGTHAVFVLIDPEETYSHPSVDKRLAVLWKTDALRGTISVRNALFHFLSASLRLSIGIMKMLSIIYNRWAYNFLFGILKL